jgi:polyisoprenoid-binding protein YceI
MSITPGTYRLGPDNATLSVRTGRRGAAAKAGHDLLIAVGAWEATLELGDPPGAGSIDLTADAGSLTVLEGTGGLQALGDDDKLSIKQTIDEDVLKGTAIRFRAAGVDFNDGRMTVQGELEFAGRQGPIAFELAVDEDDRLTGTATFAQTDWGIKPYSALFGTLKVADEVVVEIDAHLPAARAATTSSH